MSSAAEAALLLGEAAHFRRVSVCKRLLRLHPPAIITHPWRDGETPLHSAADHESILALFLTFADQIDLNVRDQENRTALMVALDKRDYRCYELLAAAGAARFPETKDARMLLLCAVAADDVERVNRLLETRAEITTDTELCKSVVDLAAEMGRAVVLKYMLGLQAFAKLITEPEEDGWNPLMAAAAGGHLDCLELLVAAGANIADLDNDGNTLLHIAAKSGHAAIVRRLLTFPELARALKQPDNDGYTPIIYAILGGSIECLQVLQEAGANLRDCIFTYWGTALHVAVRYGNVAMLVYLLSLHLFDAHINSRSRFGFTALMNAAQAGSIECYQILQDAGADPLIRTAEGQTVLSVANQGQHEEMLAFLLGIEAVRQLVNVANARRETPLVVAVRDLSVECARMLLSAGANPNTPDQYGYLPIHTASQFISSDMLQLLLQSDLSVVNTPIKGDKTPLMVAASCRRPANVRALLTAGATTSLCDKYGCTALHCAARYGSHESIQAILEFSTSELNVQDLDGMTPLMLATNKIYSVATDLLRCLQLLLDAGALVHLRNKKGETAKEIALSGEMPEFLKLLQGHEDYLAQLGSHTKPALRTPQFPLETPSAESGPQEAIFQVEETGTDISQLTVNPAELESGDLPRTTASTEQPAVHAAGDSAQQQLSQARAVAMFPLRGLDEELAAMARENEAAQQEPTTSTSAVGTNADLNDQDQEKAEPRFEGKRRQVAGAD
eukprot:m.454122 g.454122  ORF g.454122 m.454122 type:complete len:732 (-) comp56945_c0_seq3:125-2320(-)